MTRHRQLFLNHVAQTSDAPLMLEIVKADGCFMYDAEGKKYLDLIAGISVSNIGHNNEVVKAAIIKQLDNYMHVMVYGEFIETPQVQLATWLSNQLPQPLQSTYFTNSGSEAIEGALKLAKRYTARTEIISFKNGYHGSTHGALSVGGNEERKQAFLPLLPDTKLLEFNNFSHIDFITHKTACVLIEPVQAEAGIILPDPTYLQALKHKCLETGALLIFDENQTGFGRTGHVFAFQQFNCIPDILVIGKAFGGGMPLGAFISSTELMQCLTHNPVLGHITTFGGHPVCCAAGLAAATVLLQSDILTTVEKKAQLFKKLLIHKKIIQIRNSGLLMAIEFDDTQFAQSLIKRLIEKGILTDWFLFAPHCLRIAPPLIITEEEIFFACNTILSELNNS